MTWSEKYRDLIERLRHCAVSDGGKAGHILRIATLTVVYYCIAQVGFTFARGEQVTAIWPAAGLSLASILLFGYRVWPGILLGSFLSKISVHVPLAPALFIAVGNTVEPLIGIWLLRFYVGPNHYIERIRGILCLWLFASFIGPLAGAFIGSMAVWLYHLQAGVSFNNLFFTWWLADGGGALIIAPLLLSWGRPPYHMPRLRIFAEAIIFAVVAIIAAFVIFIHPEIIGTTWIRTYMIFPLVIWAAVRFEQRGITLFALGIANVALSATLRHIGPFGHVPLEQGLIVAQIYVIIVTMIGLTVTAALSERRAAEKQAHDNQRYLQDVIDHISDPVIINNEHHTLTGGNKALWALVNRTPENLIGKNSDEIFQRKEESAAFIERYDKVFGTGEPDISEGPFTDYCGNKHILAVKMALLRSEYREPSIVAVARDITPLKETEELLRKYTRDLEIRNSELDDFAYVASHDLKEPLRGLTILASLMLDDYQNKLDDELVQRLKRMMFLSQHMSQLVSDLLHFSRLGRMALEPQQVDPNVIIADIQKILEPSLKEKNAMISIVGSLPALVCDKPGLEEVFRNLITNALKYNDKEWKSVEIGFHESLVSPRQMEKNVFYVRDNGIGIEPQFFQNIFRIFKRLPGSAKYDQTGTGMGLTFVKKIIERNNGYIWLESRPGKGSTFYFTLC